MSIIHKLYIHQSKARLTGGKSIFALLTLALILSVCARGDSILLENGNRIEGRVLRDNKKEVVVKLPYGQISIPKREIKQLKQTDRVTHLLFQGEKLLHYEDYRKALEQFKKALSLKPGSAEVQTGFKTAAVKYARFLRTAKRYAEAVRVLEGALEVTPQSKKCRKELASLKQLQAAYLPKFIKARRKLAEGETEEAVRLFSELWETYPAKRPELEKPLARAQLHLGDGAFRNRSFTQASARYERALTYYPEIFPALQRRYTYSQIQVAKRLLASKDLNGAQRVLRRTLGFCPRNKVVHYLLGKVLREKGLLNEAALHYEKAGRGSEKTFHPRLEMAQQLQLADKEAGEENLKSKNKPEPPLLSSKTAHFVVKAPGRTQTGRFACAMEEYFRKLAPKFGIKDFEKRCHVTIYATKEAYLRATGGKHHEPGKATWSAKLGHLLHHKIESYVKCPQLLVSVLPHELSHILLAARLNYRKDIPLWANEGVAVLTAELMFPFRRNFYKRHLARAETQRQLFSVKALLGSETYPGKKTLPLFYAQSASLVKLLVEKTNFSVFLSFLEHLTPGSGWKPWKRYFSIRSACHLNRIWQPRIQDLEMD